MEKTIYIDEKPVRLRSTAALPAYKHKQVGLTPEEMDEGFREWQGKFRTYKC